MNVVLLLLFLNRFSRLSALKRLSLIMRSHVPVNSGREVGSFFLIEYHMSLIFFPP